MIFYFFFQIQKNEFPAMNILTWQKIIDCNIKKNIFLTWSSVNCKSVLSISFHNSEKSLFLNYNDFWWFFLDHSFWVVTIFYEVKLDSLLIELIE